MKKTLIALLIAGSCAMGITLEDAAKTGTGNLTLDEATGAITAVAVVDVAKLQTLMAHNAELAKYTLINFDGGSDIGLQTNYGSHNHDGNNDTPNVINTSGLWGCWNGGSAYSFGSNDGFENATFWEGGVTAAVTLTYVFSQVVTAEEAKSLGKAAAMAALSSVAVPEPTTATLSLLALVGLAARRRRK